MSRLRTDQACLDAQLRQQVQCQLTAELAQPRDTIPCPAPTESLERASARVFAESMRPECPPPHRDVFAEPCWICKANPGAPCRSIRFGGELSSPHAGRIAIKTPTAPDCAAATAPDVDETVLARAVEKSGRPTCACGQSIWTDNLVKSPRGLCSDCEQEFDREPFERFVEVAPLDRRIAEAREPDAVQCAWSTPSSEGESW